MAQQQKQPIHWRQVTKRLNAHLLFAEDLGPVGTKVDVEVNASGAFKVKGEDGEKEMVWVGFAGKKKQLGLNAGNCKAMETLTGTPDYTTWRGWITLVVIRTKYFDQKTRAMMETDAVRISTERPRGKSTSSQQSRSAESTLPVGEPAFDPSDIRPEDK